MRFEARRIELRSEPRRVQLGLQDALRVVGSDGTVSIVEIVSLSSRVERPKSQEGNKSFVPELPRVVSVSSVFRIHMLVNVSRIRMFYISVYFTYSYLAMLHSYIENLAHRNLVVGKVCHFSQMILQAFSYVTAKSTETRVIYSSRHVVEGLKFNITLSLLLL